MASKRVIGLYTLAAAGVVVVIIMAHVAGGFLGNASPSLLGASPTPGITLTPAYGQTPTATLPPSPTPDIVDGFQLYINPDHSFSLRFPRSWRQDALPPSSGQGISFDSLADPYFIVSNLGASPSSPAAFIASYCTSSRGKLQPATTVRIGGQAWTQAECDTTDGPGHFAVEAVVYQGHLYYISYGSYQSTFEENKATYFLRMQQSFSFFS